MILLPPPLVRISIRAIDGNIVKDTDKSLRQRGV